MLWCLLLAAGVITKFFGFSGYQDSGMPVNRKSLARLSGSDFEKIRLPYLHRDDFTERSFQGRTQNDIRLPHGANPQMKHIENLRFFHNKKFQKRYQKNLHTTLIENNNWKMDKTQYGLLGGYAKVHNPENNYAEIKRFSNRCLPSVPNMAVSQFNDREPVFSFK